MRTLFKIMGSGLVLVAALGAIIFLVFFNPFSQPPSQNQPYSPPYSPPNPSANSSANISTADTAEAQWALITKQNVESACLSQAKSEAVAQGYSGAVVFSCSCNAQEGQDTKSYDCKVGALDGDHPVGIVCNKALQACQISSEKGNSTYTFAQLQSMSN